MYHVLKANFFKACSYILVELSSGADQGYKAVKIIQARIGIAYCFVQVTYLTFALTIDIKSAAKKASILVVFNFSGNIS